MAQAATEQAITAELLLARDGGRGGGSAAAEEAAAARAAAAWRAAAAAAAGLDPGGGVRYDGGGRGGGGGGTGGYLIKFFDTNHKLIMGPVAIPDIGPENTLRELREKVRDTIDVKWDEQGFQDPVLLGKSMPNPDQTLEFYRIPLGSVFVSVQKPRYRVEGASEWSPI
jgi:hypothetical protein